MSDDNPNNDDHDTQEDTELVLTFTVEGGAILEEEDELVWASDDDDDFSEEFENEFLDADNDSARVLNYLEEEGFLDEDEKADVIVEQETNGDDNEET